jgi:hypothetical protein
MRKNQMMKHKSKTPCRGRPAGSVTRNGKSARLPRALRDKLNHHLQDGENAGFNFHDFI